MPVQQAGTATPSMVNNSFANTHEAAGAGTSGTMSRPFTTLQQRATVVCDTFLFQNKPSSSHAMQRG